MPKKGFWDYAGEGLLIGIELADRRKARQLQERQIKVQEDYAQLRREEQAAQNAKFLYEVFQKARDDKTKKTIGTKAIDSLAKENILSETDEVVLKSLLSSGEYEEFYKELAKINDSEDPKTYSTDQYFGTLMAKQDQGIPLTEKQQERLNAWEKWKFSDSGSKPSEPDKARTAIATWAPQLESGEITINDVPAEWRPTLIDYGSAMHSIMADDVASGGKGQLTWLQLLDRVDDIYDNDHKQKYEEDWKYDSWNDAFTDYVNRISKEMGLSSGQAVTNEPGMREIGQSTFATPGNLDKIIKSPDQSMDNGQKAKEYFQMKRKGESPETKIQSPKQVGPTGDISLEQKPLNMNPMAEQAEDEGEWRAFQQKVSEKGLTPEQKTKAKRHFPNHAIEIERM